MLRPITTVKAISCYSHQIQHNHKSRSIVTAMAMLAVVSATFVLPVTRSCNGDLVIHNCELLYSPD